MKGDLLDPEMPAQEMRLHMGEMTAQEIRTARAAIRWANTRLRAALTTIHAMSLEPSGHDPNARRQMGEIAMRALEGETNG